MSKPTNYKVTDLTAKLADQMQAIQSVERDGVPDLTPRQARRGLKVRKYTRRLLEATEVLDNDDRSERIYELAAALQEDGATPPQAFVLIRESVWNKFAGRADEVERLWETVERAEPEQEHIGFESFADFMARPIAPPKWLVEGVWTAESCGFAVGRAKAFKSTVTTDLALSVASGSRFLGRFTVDDPGPVILVQEENPEGLQQKRMRQMCASKGLHWGSSSFDGTTISISEADDVPLHIANGTGFDMSSQQWRQALEEFIQQIRPKLIILDPLYVMSGEWDPMNSKDMARVVRWMVYLKTKYKTAVLIVHHNKKMPDEVPDFVPDLMFGSSFLANGFDCGLFMFPRKDDSVHVVREFRAWKRPPFDYQIFMDEEDDFYHVKVVEHDSEFRDPTLELIRRMPGSTVQVLSERIGISERAVRKRLTALKERQLVRFMKKAGPKGGSPSIHVYVNDNVVSDVGGSATGTSE